MGNPYSTLISKMGLNRDSQGELSKLFVLCKALESGYSSGWTAGTAGAYLMTQVESVAGKETQAVVQLRALLTLEGQL
jgi:hypothetical protein